MEPHLDSDYNFMKSGPAFQIFHKRGGRILYYVVYERPLSQKQSIL